LGGGEQNKKKKQKKTKKTKTKQNKQTNKQCSLSPSISGFRSNTTCPRTNLAISFQVNTSHVIAVRQNMLPGLLELLRFVELYLKHATERH
jgi:hypothetical protein